MYAIISDSGKQFRVEKDQQFCVDYRDVKEGEQIVFDQILAVSGEAGFQLGKPTLAGARVTAEVVGPKFGDKLTVQKFRRRKNSRRRTGHRQLYTMVVVKSIQA